jgi:two-component sensor histidine kinase
LAAQKQALELAVSGAPIGVVLSPVVAETRKQVSGDARVALHIVDPDGARLRFGAAAEMPEHYRSAVDGFEIRPTNPACGKVAFTGERIIVEDVTTDPLWEPYRALAQQLDIRACWSFPIRSVAADKILGTIAIYYDTPREPQQEDIDAVELLTQTASLIIERHKAAEERTAAHESLRRSESRLRLALAGARAAAWEWDAVTDDIQTSPEMFAITGLASEGGPHRLESYLEMIEEEDRDHGILQDITERKAHEERIHPLMREVNHRAKNMLSLVQAIARQTAAREPEDFIGCFAERIQALAANQDLLIRNEWHGVDVDDLVRAQLAHFVDLVGSRIVVRGPPLRLKPASAQAVGLALHELATNAGKYGALSTDRGRVDVHWGTVGDTFAMSWSERDGPPISAPKGRGFGTTVIEAMAQHSLDGAVDLDFAPSGLSWQLVCPLANALEDSERKARPRQG